MKAYVYGVKCNLPADFQDFNELSRFAIISVGMHLVRVRRRAREEGHRVDRLPPRRGAHRRRAAHSCQIGAAQGWR
jgi:hypothetical protein